MSAFCTKRENLFAPSFEKRGRGGVPAYASLISVFHPLFYQSQAPNLVISAGKINDAHISMASMLPNCYTNELEGAVKEVSSVSP